MLRIAYIITVVLLLTTGCESGNTEDSALLEKGVEALNNNNLLESYQYTQKAIDAMEEKGDSGKLLEAKAFLGVLYHTMGQGQEAYDTFKSLPLDNARGRRISIFQLCLSCMAYYTANIDRNYATALDYGQRVISLTERDKGNDNIAYTAKLNQAEIYMMAGDTAEARGMVNSIDTAAIVSNNMLCLSQLRAVQAQLFMQQHDYSQARACAKELIGKDKLFWDIDNTITALEIMTEVDSMRCDISNYIANRNMLDSLRNNVQGDEMKYKLLLTKEQYKMETMKMENSKRRAIYNCGIGLLFIIAISLSVVLVIQYRQRKILVRMNEMERCKFDEDIERKRLENELLQLKMKKKEEELSDVYKDNVSMSVLLVETPTDSKDYATQLEYLETLLKRKYGDFLKKLNRQYPRLSYNESLIMGFTRMGISQKDIATALGISQESLNKARYRLRKKIGLKDSNELDELIGSL